MRQVEFLAATVICTALMLPRLAVAQAGPLIPPSITTPDKVETRIGTLDFTHDFANGYPTDETVEKLYDERDFQRACQAYLWSLPAVSFTAWQHGVAKGLGAKVGLIASHVHRPPPGTSWPAPTAALRRLSRLRKR